MNDATEAQQDRMEEAAAARANNRARAEAKYDETVRAGVQRDQAARRVARMSLVAVTVAAIVCLLARWLFRDVAPFVEVVALMGAIIRLGWLPRCLRPARGAPVVDEHLAGPIAGAGAQRAPAAHPPSSTSADCNVPIAVYVSGCGGHEQPRDVIPLGMSIAEPEDRLLRRMREEEEGHMREHARAMAEWGAKTNAKTSANEVADQKECVLSGGALVCATVAFAMSLAHMLHWLAYPLALYTEGLALLGAAIALGWRSVTLRQPAIARRSLSVRRGSVRRKTAATSLADATPRPGPGWNGYEGRGEGEGWSESTRVRACTSGLRKSRVRLGRR